MSYGPRRAINAAAIQKRIPFFFLLLSVWRVRLHAEGKRRSAVRMDEKKEGTDSVDDVGKTKTKQTCHRGPPPQNNVPMHLKTVSSAVALFFFLPTVCLVLLWPRQNSGRPKAIAARTDRQNHKLGKGRKE